MQRLLRTIVVVVLLLVGLVGGLAMFAMLFLRYSVSVPRYEEGPRVEVLQQMAIDEQGNIRAMEEQQRAMREQWVAHEAEVMARHAQAKHTGIGWVTIGMLLLLAAPVFGVLSVAGAVFLIWRRRRNHAAVTGDSAGSRPPDMAQTAQDLHEIAARLAARVENLETVLLDTVDAAKANREPEEVATTAGTLQNEGD